MGKQRRLQEIKAEREAGTYQPPGTKPDRVVQLFQRHYELACESMTPEHAAATAHDAVQRHLASLKEVEAGDQMK